jgi:hypothetical protein
MKSRSLAALCMCLSVAAAMPAHADATLTTFHYNDLYGIQQGVAALQDLKRLRVGLYITSTRPDVPRDTIKMVIHRASGALVDIPVDATGHMDLPVSADLKTENPSIVTNQPRHTLQATVAVDLVRLSGTEMSYSDLILGVTQFNTGIDRNGAMSLLRASKADGLLLFYNDGGHSITLHAAQGDRTFKSQTLSAAKARLKNIQTKYHIHSATVIYIPLDKQLLQEDPRLNLDRLPDDTYPAI